VDTNGKAITALADPTRRAIFERLRHGPLAVGELARGVPVSRPAVSQHLKVLKEAGLVSERKNGTRRLYRIEPQGIEALRAYFDEFWDAALAAFKEAVERDEEEALACRRWKRYGSRCWSRRRRRRRGRCSSTA
jgi:DNA-binding transcriptional ArsR family regulator